MIWRAFPGITAAVKGTVMTENQKRTAFVLIALAALLMLAALLNGACSSPCDELASTICGCEKTTDRRDACKKTFVTGNPVSISSKRQDVCSKYLDSCTCDALDAGQFEACGLTAAPAATTP